MTSQPINANVTVEIHLQTVSVPVKLNSIDTHLSYSSYGVIDVDA